MSEEELDEFRAARGRAGAAGRRAQPAALPHRPPERRVRAVGRARPTAASCPTPGEVLELVGLDERSNAPLGTLTPGQLQLAALAVAVATSPGLLLGDEPTSQLDHEARDTVLDALGQINAEMGTTIVVVTHDPDVAARMPRTVTIRDGRVGGEGRARARSSPWSPPTARSRCRPTPSRLPARGAGAGARGGGRVDHPPRGRAGRVSADGARVEVEGVTVAYGPVVAVRERAWWPSPAAWSRSPGTRARASRRCCGPSPARSAGRGARADRRPGGARPRRRRRPGRSPSSRRATAWRPSSRPTRTS